MKKVISYSLFDSGLPEWEFLFYLRGFYFNVLMNKLVYPGWTVVVHVEYDLCEKYLPFFEWMFYNHGVLHKIKIKDNLCKSMLWRMEPIFYEGVEIVLCRDADALTSYREAQAVQQWINSGEAVHGMQDNPAHSVPIMGGMCGFRCQPIRDKYGSYEEMIGLSPKEIDKRGSDQDFLTGVLYRDFKHSIMLYNGNLKDAFPFCLPDVAVDGVDKRLWTSNLCSFFIGAAGCNEMETLRFFRDNLPSFADDSLLWAQYPKIFYWS